MSVASKNLFDLLGNDVEGDESPAAPVKTVEKTSTHTTKRNADGAAPSKAPATSTPRRGGASGNEAAFRDRNAGHDRNRGKPTDEARAGGPRGGYGARSRGGRGGRFPRNQDDRHSKTGVTDTEKATAQGWGATEGEAELKDEQAGEEIAQKEKAEGEAGEAEEAKEEEEDKHITLDQYLAQQAEKKLALESSFAPRKANEGTKEDKKWAAAKPLVKDEDEDYFAGTGGKAKRERERKVKQLVEIDNRFVEPERSGRGGRGGRGGSRGDGPRGGGRGRGAPRGEFRGGRGGPRQGGENKAPVNTSDESAFPSLGGK
ncbi:hypothetical protein OQA88_84 [Cercophora sp. LCS_1]